MNLSIHVEKSLDVSPKNLFFVEGLLHINIMAVHVEFHVEKLLPCSLRTPLTHFWVLHGGLRLLCRIWAAQKLHLLSNNGRFHPLKIDSSFDSGGRLRFVGTLAHVNRRFSCWRSLKDYRFSLSELI